MSEKPKPKQLLEDDGHRTDEILRRMLAMPPDPHKKPRQKVKREKPAK
jgi:hypothetical protein